MEHGEYLMESKDEVRRLELKTDFKTLEKQALWAGIGSGMSVADIGCGSGITTFYLKKLVEASGKVVGVDRSEERIAYAKHHYTDTGIEFRCRDINKPLDDIGLFDFVWVRFILEYHRSKSFDLVKNISKMVKPGGIFCLIDLDYNCLSHFGIPRRLEKTLYDIMNILENHADFDPYAGRKLYSFIYDLGYENINVDMSPYHLIFGELKETDEFNWTKKVEVAAKKSGCRFEEYNRGYEEFCEEFKKSFADPRRFTYTPVISCRGRKPKSIS
jgi:SAM-dependent methyltransferase